MTENKDGAVNRFYPTVSLSVNQAHARMTPHAEGEYVLYSDYEAGVKRRTDAQKALWFKEPDLEKEFEGVTWEQEADRLYRVWRKNYEEEYRKNEAHLRKIASLEAKLERYRSALEEIESQVKTKLIVLECDMKFVVISKIVRAALSDKEEA